MNSAVTTDDETSRPRPRRERVPLYLWWRRSIVGSVDHQAVLATITEDSGLTPRYLFMTMMSAGIAVLGLLLSSPAVVIGAMLISPLMGPILGLGFGLAVFDFTELRRSSTAFLLGSIAAVLFTALIVILSPLTALTTEILARTRPNLFDLLVALFAALAGSFAIIRGRGGTIVGVAIATALMPPLAVVGYGLATWNIPVLAGSFALFMTNFVTIALGATIVARFYGFGHHLSSQQSWTQTILLVLAFIAMAIPLAFSLSQIAREALVVNQVRSYLGDRFGPGARVTQLDVDFRETPWTVRAIVIAPRSRAIAASELRSALNQRLQRPVSLQIDQILIDPGEDGAAKREALERANAKANPGNQNRNVAGIVAVAAGVAPDAVTLDTEHQRVVVAAEVLPGAPLGTYRELEARAAALVPDWTVEITPPATAFPEIQFADESDVLDAVAREAVLTSVWAARRWNQRALAVPGLAVTDADAASPSLAERRANAVATILRNQGISAVPAPASGARFVLSEPATGGAR